MESNDWVERTNTHGVNGNKYKQVERKAAGIANPMARYYTKFLSVTMAEAIELQLTQPEQEQVKVFEELALMRQTAGDAVKMYTVACVALEEKPNDHARQGFVMQAASIMRAYLTEVTEICERAARIEASLKSQRFSLGDIRAIVNRFVDIVHNSCDGDVHIAERIGTNIREQFKLPAYVDDYAPGVNKVPADDVLKQIDAMDASIPISEPDEHERYPDRNGTAG